MKKQPTQQTTSEKKLFAEVKELRTTVEDVKAVVKEWVTTIDAQYRRVHKEVDALKQTNREVEFVAMHEKLHELHKAIRNKANVATDFLINQKLDKPKPEDYVLTDADWQRVIKEGWLCEFETASGTSRSIGTLEEIRAGDYCHHAHGYFTKCRPLNRPGVLQPYFGQGMPVKAGTKVLTKQRRGSHCIGKALEQDWDIENNSSDIVAFMILETV